MITKKILDADRIRRIEGGFSFIPHRFLTAGFLASLQPQELMLYVFLVLAADRHGLSYYSYERICSLLHMTVELPQLSHHCAGRYIQQAMHKAGLTSTPYWLRHSYAQHLLSSGASIYEIKQMLGHRHIESSRKYLHIHTDLMREVILDEPL